MYFLYACTSLFVSFLTELRLIPNTNTPLGRETAADMLWCASAQHLHCTAGLLPFAVCRCGSGSLPLGACTTAADLTRSDGSGLDPLGACRRARSIAEVNKSGAR